MKNLKKFLCVLLSVAMVLSTLTVTALADGGTEIAVNAAWSSKAEGDTVTVGTKDYTYGTDAFSQMVDAVEATKSTPVTYVVDGSGNVGEKEVTIGTDNEGTVFNTPGTYNIVGTNWANLGYLQLNQQKASTGDRYVLNISDSNLIATKPQLRGLADLNITNSHVDFAMQSGASSGYLFVFRDSTVNVENSVLGYYTGNGNSSAVVPGQTSTNTAGYMSTWIYGSFNADTSTVFAFGGDTGVNAFTLLDKGRATLTDSVLYTHAIIIGSTENRSERDTVGYNGNATLTLDGSQVYANNGYGQGLKVGDAKAGDVVMTNGSSINYSTLPVIISSNGTLSIDGTSSITASAFTNSGTITIDMTGAKGGEITLISGGAGSNFGSYEFATGKDCGYTLKVENNKLIAEKEVVYTYEGGKLLADGEEMSADEVAAFTGVNVQGINGYDTVVYATIQDAYNALKPVVVDNGIGKEGNQPNDKILTLFSDVTDKTVEGTDYKSVAVTWNVWGEQTLPTGYYLTLGREQGCMPNNYWFNDLSVIGQNDAAKITASSYTLPWSYHYSTPDAREDVNFTLDNLTLVDTDVDGISFARNGVGLGGTATFNITNCDINGGINMAGAYQGNSVWNVNNNVFTYREGGYNTYAFFLNGVAANNVERETVVNFEDNTVSGYVRGTNFSWFGGSLTFEGNEVTPGAGYSAVQVSNGVGETTIESNEIHLNGGNVLTIHESNAGKTLAITVKDNTIDGTGYAIYDDITAEGKSYGSGEGQANVTLVWKNNPCDTMDTENGIKGSKVVASSSFVKEALAPVAQIGEEKYSTLEEAIAAAVEAGVETEIVIIKDIAYTEFTGIVQLRNAINIPAAANVVLDLNGHTISGTSNEANSSYLLYNRGTLKIVDSGENGKITFKSDYPDPAYGYGTSTILNRGVLTITDGTIENTTVNGASYAVDNQTQWYDEIVPVVFNLTGGELICTTGDAALRQCSNLVKYQGEYVKNNINISGGTVTGDIWIQNLNASYSDLQISDGTVTGKIYATVTDNTNLTATISGGTIGQLDRSNATVPFKEGIVKGGNFTNKPLDGFLAEGFKLVYDETTGKYVAEEQQVAKIGEKTYSTLNAAIKDVNNQTGDDVTLEILADITEELPHKTEIKFTKNLTITADSAVKVDFVDADNGVYLGPGNDKTLTIAENVTIRNLCTTGPDETTGTLIVNGTVGVSYIRAYGPKESDGIATTIINGKIIDDHEGCIRLSQNCKFVVNGNIAEGDDVRAAEKSLDGFYFSDVNCKNCEFILNNAAVGLYDWFEASSNINFTLNNSYVAYTTYYVVGNHTYTLDSSSAFDVKDTIKVFADSSLKVNGGDVALKTAINNGTATFEGTAKVNATSWAGNFNVKDATLTTDGFTQTSGKVNAFGTSTLTGFALKDVVVGFENSSETSDELTLAGETTCGDVYVGQDEVSERTYKLNVTGTATLGQAYVRQNGQVNIVDGADVKALYNCIYGQLNVTGGSTYTITGVNFYLAGRDSKNAKDKAIITVDNSTLNHPNSVGLEIGGGTGPAGSGKLVLKNGAVFNGTTLLLGDNAEGALGTIAVEATDSTINLTNALTIGAGDTVSLKKSTVSAKTVANAGTISVDMTGATDKVVTLITAANASDYGTYQILEGKDYNYELKVDGNNLVAEKNTDFFKDAEGVWHIATLKGLQQFAASVQAGNTYYGKKVVLDADIDMSSIENWTPICSGGKSFSGTFDGKGNTISNLTIDGGTAEGTSFFGDAGNPTIEGVTFDKATVKGGDRTSVVVNGLAYVTGVTVTNSSVVGNEYVAAIAGSAYTTIVGCTVRKCSIKAVEQVGALEGYVCGSKITGNTVDECTIEATAARAGGLAGKIQADDNGTTTGYVWSDNIITNTTVTAPDWVGGIAGQLMGEYATYEIKNNEIDATLDTTGTNVSPLAPLRAGQKAAFAGALSENVTDNTWTEKTWAENGYVFTNLPEGVEPQGSYNVKPNYNYYASLTLIENIDVNLVVGNLGEGFELDKLAVTVNGEAIDLELDGENVVGLLKSLAPYQISKTLSVVVTYGGEEIKSFDYSIRKYCVTVLTTEGFGVDSDLGKLCKAVLNYGKWAEDYYNEVQKTGEEPSIVNKDYEIDFTTVTIPKQPDTGFTPSTLFKAASASLALGSKISINFYVKTNVNLNKDNIKIVYTENSKDYQVDKNNIEITNDSGVYCIKVSNIDAAKLARTYKLVTAYAYADVFSVTYGAYTYCYDIQNLEGEGITDTLKTLCKAIYNYGEMAKAFN